jgi:metal-dependent amidase/aminoacylase/carboxypeptidase family protein
MNMGWNMRREHLRPEQRSHYVITDGGDQPNVVPSRPRLVLFPRAGFRPHRQELRDW